MVSGQRDHGLPDGFRPTPSQEHSQRWPRCAAGSIALLTDENGNVALVKPTYNDRGWYLVGGAVEEGEDPEQALAREIHEETGLRRRAGRLLVSEWVPADPARDKPAGPNYVWDVEPMGAQDVRRVRLSAEHSAWTTVPIRDIKKWTLPPLARRIRAAARAKAAGTHIWLPPSEPSEP